MVKNRELGEFSTELSNPELIEISSEAELKKIMELREEISEKIENERWGSIPGFLDYLGVRLGEETVMNSPFTSDQLEFTLAMSQHPLVLELAKDEDLNWESFDPSKLIENKVSTGIKAIDLGSGTEPFYARAARLMGAEIYTVDVIPFDHMDTTYLEVGKRKGFDLELERAYHIQLDLNSPDAAQLILEKTNGGLNLLTSAHAGTGWRHEDKLYYFTDEERLGNEILLPGGVGYIARGRDSDAFLKELAV